MSGQASGRFSASRSTRGTAAILIGTILLLGFLIHGVAGATVAPPADLGVEVGLSPGQGAGIGISTIFKIASRNGERTPPVERLSLVGDIGSLDLRGVPTCRPSPLSATSPGCAAPQIGVGGGQAILENDPESKSVKLPGEVRIYSGGQRGPVSKLWAWAVFPPGGTFDPTTVLVIPITLTRRGIRQSELQVRLPQPETGFFSVTELRLNLRKSVRVDGRSLPLSSVSCPVGAGARATAEVAFYDYPTSATVSTTTAPTCHG
jgi:hypothetical protein